ncbi:unnamed protein product [Leptosia nina]|uniref:Uncharacterized protein n=1 Tax=Leptosia nina TaxID=320188 RepID=A0AAV1JEP0_9NEOP
MVKLNTPEQEEKTPNNQEKTPDLPVRERTQTDDLNKKLLTSLFNRMNEGGDTMLSKMLEPDNKTDEDDEWK